MSLLLALLITGCSRGSDWPADELTKLRDECDRGPSSPDPAETHLTCTCMYERLPKRLAWKDYSAWRAVAATPTATRDPAVTRAIAEVSAECAVEVQDRQ
jgi:hypothetical protein